MITVASGPSSMLQDNHAFQLGKGGDHGTTPADCAFESTNSSNTVLLNKDTASDVESLLSY